MGTRDQKKWATSIFPQVSLHFQLMLAEPTFGFKHGIAGLFSFGY